MDETVKALQIKNYNELNRTHESNDVLYDAFLNSSSKVKHAKEAAVIKQVCQAEKESQKLLSKLYAYRAPFGKRLLPSFIMNYYLQLNCAANGNLRFFVKGASKNDVREREG